MNEVDVVSVHTRWSPRAGSLLGKIRILVRFGGFDGIRNEYQIAEFTGEDLSELAYQFTQFILEAATG